MFGCHGQALTLRLRVSLELAGSEVNLAIAYFKTVLTARFLRAATERPRENLGIALLPWRSMCQSAWSVPFSRSISGAQFL